MTFSEFIDLVSSEMNKGTTYDTFIPARVRMAGQRIEQNYSLKYMETLDDLTLEVDESEIDVPTRMKSLLWLRRTTDQVPPTFVYLHQVDAEQFLFLQDDFPSGFWQEGNASFHFDAEPTDDAVPLEIYYNRYTDWASASAESTDTFWLLDNATSLMLAMTMKLLGPVAREKDWLGLYEEMQEEGERVLLNADQELRRATKDEVMIYANRGSTG